MRKNGTMSEKASWSRRNFLKGVAGGAALAGLSRRARPRSLRAQESSSGRKVRIGVVGGNFGRVFYWHLHPDSTVTAVCDLREDRLAALVDTYGTHNAYKDFRTFLREGEMDAVAVFTPAPLHVWMATEALKSGRHVISAVPAGMSIEECEQLVEAVEKSGLHYMMAETSFFRPEIITCREWSEQGKFGTIHYAESEYHHEGLIPLMYDDKGFPTWRHGFPPMHYPTHCTGMVIPVMNEYLTKVSAVGWGDGHEVLQTNEYENPFWNTNAFFKTTRGHSARISVMWHVAAGGVERGSFFGDRHSYFMARPEGPPNTVVSISQEGRVVLDEDGYPQGEVNIEAYEQPPHHEKLPEPLRVISGHGGSHTHITHEFIRALVEDRSPAVDVYEAVNYTVPGIVAHQSALRDGETLPVPLYGKKALGQVGTPAAATESAR